MLVLGMVGLQLLELLSSRCLKLACCDAVWGLGFRVLCSMLSTDAAAFDVDKAQPISLSPSPQPSATNTKTAIVPLK